MNHWEKLSKYILSAAAAYGSYKASILLVAVASNVWKSLNQLQAIINITRAVKGLTQATKAQALAQGLMNKVAMVNPYVAIATILATAAGSMILFSDKAKSTQDIITELNESFGKMQSELEKSKGTERLIDEYEQLSRKQEKTAEESEKLERVTKTLSDQFGNSVADVDKYGNKVGLLIGKMRDLNKETLKMLKEGYDVSLKDSESKLKSLNEMIALYTHPMICMVIRYLLS